MDDEGMVKLNNIPCGIFLRAEAVESLLNLVKVHQQRAEHCEHRGTVGAVLRKVCASIQ